MLGREVINSLIPLTGSVWMSQSFSAAHNGVPDTTRRRVSSVHPPQPEVEPSVWRRPQKKTFLGGMVETAR